MMRHRHGMTARARLYLGIAAVRHFCLAALCLVAPGTLAQSASVYPIIAALALWVWGLIFLVAGITCALGLWRRGTWLARFGLMWSASSTAMVAMALITAIGTHVSDGAQVPIGMLVETVLWGALAAKDFTICANPIRSPFEEWVQDLIDDQREGGDSTQDSA